MKLKQMLTVNAPARVYVLLDDGDYMLKYNIKDIKDKLKIINPNIEVLSPSYQGAHAKMKLKCLKDGYEWEACWNSLSNGTGCPKCANRPRYSIDMVKAELLAISPNIEILSTEYKNNHSHLTNQTLKI